jgi:ABC-2 type transport system ATP-binding protein
LSEEAKAEIAALIKRHGGEILSLDNPTTTMEELFLDIVRQSENRPGHRSVE